MSANPPRFEFHPEAGPGLFGQLCGFASGMIDAFKRRQPLGAVGLLPACDLGARVADEGSDLMHSPPVPPFQ